MFWVYDEIAQHSNNASNLVSACKGVQPRPQRTDVFFQILVKDIIVLGYGPIWLTPLGEERDNEEHCRESVRGYTAKIKSKRDTYIAAGFRQQRLHFRGQSPCKSLLTMESYPTSSGSSSPRGDTSKHQGHLGLDYNWAGLLHEQEIKTGRHMQRIRKRVKSQQRQNAAPPAQHCLGKVARLYVIRKTAISGFFSGPKSQSSEWEDPLGLCWELSWEHVIDGSAGTACPCSQTMQML